MKEVFRFSRVGIVLAMLWLVPGAFAVSSGQLTAYEIISKAVERTKSSCVNPAAYAFTKTTVREERNNDGELKERERKSDRVIFQNGAYFKSNRAASGFVMNQDSNLLPLDTGRSNRRKDYLDMLTPELVDKYAFTLVSRVRVNGRSAYEIAFRPRAQNLPASDLKERIMNRATGTLWIDDSEFELVRARIHVNSEIPVGGFLGALKRAAFSLERIRLESGAWFERFYKTDYEARKLATVKRVTTLSECDDFRKLNNG